MSSAVFFWEMKSGVSGFEEVQKARGWVEKKERKRKTTVSKKCRNKQDGGENKC